MVQQAHSELDIKNKKSLYEKMEKWKGKMTSGKLKKRTALQTSPTKHHLETFENIICSVHMDKNATCT